MASVGSSAMPLVMAKGGKPTSNCSRDTLSQGKGCGRGRRDGQMATARASPAFKGHTMELGGHIFQVFHESNNCNQFARTVEALSKYFANNMKYARDMMLLTQDLVNPEAAKPVAIAKGKTDMEIVFKWEKEMTDYITQKNVLNSNLKASYIIIWGQCSKAMRAKIKSANNYEAKNTACNCEWLLKAIRGTMLCFDGQCKIHQSISNAHGAYHAYHPAQDACLVLVDLEEFSALVGTIEHYGGCIGHDMVLMDMESIILKLNDKKKQAQDKLLAMDFLKKAL